LVSDVDVHAAIVGYGIRSGGSKSADVWRGGYLALWLSSVGAIGALKYFFLTFSALYILVPIGLIRSPRQLQLIAIASVPAIVALVYVQQPDRALWNFHFIVIPIAVVALTPVPAWVSWPFVVSFGIANLRIGAQLQTPYVGRLALLTAITLAFAVVWRDVAYEPHIVSEG